MAINMPHSGGLHSLGVLFGTADFDEYFVIQLWTSNMVDYDDAVDDTSAFIYMSTGFPGEYEVGSLKGEEITAAELQAKIQVVGGVPQVEFPTYECIFKDTFNQTLYGYGVFGLGASGGNTVPGILYFREKFTAPFEPAGKKLAFIPTLKLGNTTSPLT